MLKERASNSKSTYDPYDCALQLKKVLENSNVAPIMTIVIFDLLSKVDLDENYSDWEDFYILHFQKTSDYKVR